MLTGIQKELETRICKADQYAPGLRNDFCKYQACVHQSGNGSLATSSQDNLLLHAVFC